MPCYSSEALAQRGVTGRDRSAASIGEVIMFRLFVSAIMFLAIILAAPAGDPPDVKEFAKDIEQLNGSWRSPTIVFIPGVMGRWELKLEFKKDSTIGQASVFNFVSKFGIFVMRGPTWTAELKEKDKKRFIVLAETKDGKRVELTEIAYEVKGDKVKLTSSKTIQFEKGGYPIEIRGEWERKNAGKK